MLYKETFHYEVVVIGGGTAGCAAAIASARAGAKTILIERQSFLGGTATGGQVTPMMHAGCPDSSSINLELKAKMAAQGNGAVDNCGNDGWFNPEMLKFTLEDMITQSDCDLLYDTDFADARTEDGKIESISVNNRAGNYKINGGMFIDATADAVLAYAAGAHCFYGNEKTHENQAMSLRFMLANVDINRLNAYLRGIGENPVLELPFFEMSAEWQKDTPLSGIFKRAVEDGVLTQEDCAYVQAFSVPGMSGIISFNCPRIPDRRNMLNPFAVTNGIVTGRRMIKKLHQFLREYLEGFENSFIISTAQMPGIRESRRIKGKYVLSIRDYAERAKFEDAIARTAYPVDVHGNHSDTTLGISLMKPGEYMEIPFRCIVSDNINNLLACGRCISSDFIAQSAIRIQSTCRATGEAAGIAAAYCIKNGMRLSALDGRIVRDIMKSKGTFL